MDEPIITMTQKLSTNFLKQLQKLLLLVILTLGLILFFSLHLYQYFHFAILQKYHDDLQQWALLHPIKSVLLFCLTYTLIIALCIPGGLILTITGGFLFGIVHGALYVIISATFGATLFFIIAKTTLSSFFAKKSNSLLKKVQMGFQDNAFNYLLFLRLVPIFPFWFTNIVSALFGVRLKPFVIATFFGVMPATFVYVSVGNGLETVFHYGKAPNLGIIFTPTIMLPLLGLAILSLLPAIYKIWKKDHHHETNA